MSTHIPTTSDAESIPVRIGTPPSAKPRKITVQFVSASETHTKTHPSQTLMRTAVKKPTNGLKKTLNVQSALAKPANMQIVPKQSVQSVNTARLQRAQTVPRSHKVNHYGIGFGTPTVYAHVPVQDEPVEQSFPEVKELQATVAHTKDMFEEAIATASHYVDVSAQKVHFKKQARSHLASMTAGIAALLVIAGFATFINSPSLQLQVAALRAGIHTANPNFAKTGFAFNGVAVKNNYRVISLKNSLTTYTLSQQATNWNETDMIKQVSSYDASGALNYQTVHAGAQTVYKLSDTQATWIKDGTWYQVNGSQPLSDRQLQAIAENS